jgi:hypothetical protein
MRKLSDEELRRRRKINKVLLPLVIAVFGFVLYLAGTSDKPAQTTAPQSKTTQSTAGRVMTGENGVTMEGAVIAMNEESLKEAINYVQSGNKDAFERMRKRRDIVPIATGTEVTVVNYGLQISEVEIASVGVRGFMMTDMIAKK